VSRWAIVAVDMDGTLVRGTTTCLHLGQTIGHGPVIAELEQRYLAGEIDNTAVAEGDAVYYAGHDVESLTEALATIPCIGGIADGVSLLVGRGLLPVIATVSWTFAAQYLADRFGFAEVCGAALESDDGRFTGRVARHFEREHKVDFVRGLCVRIGVPMTSVVAIGDGFSDLPLFEAVGFSVALNASAGARRAASAVVDSDDFVDALRAVPGLIE
jgi:phosphoserine phosphatase